MGCDVSQRCRSAKKVGFLTGFMFWFCSIFINFRIEGIMDKHLYVEILEENMLPSARKLKLGRHWIFQQDNDPKHTSHVAKAYFKNNGIKVLEWPAMNPDLNPIENLWRVLKIAVTKRQPSNKEVLWQYCQEEWEKIPVSVCSNLIQTYNNRLQAVIKAKGHATKY